MRLTCPAQWQEKRSLMLQDTTSGGLRFCSDWQVRNWSIILVCVLGTDVIFAESEEAQLDLARHILKMSGGASSAAHVLMRCELTPSGPMIFTLPEYTNLIFKIKWAFFPRGGHYSGMGGLSGSIFSEKCRARVCAFLLMLDAVDPSLQVSGAWDLPVIGLAYFSQIPPFIGFSLANLQFLQLIICPSTICLIQSLFRSSSGLLVNTSVATWWFFMNCFHDSHFAFVVSCHQWPNQCG